MIIHFCDRCGKQLDNSKLKSILYFKVEDHILEFCEECNVSFNEWFRAPKRNNVDISEGIEKPSNPCLKCDSSTRQSCCGCPTYYEWIEKIYPPEQTEQK